MRAATMMSFEGATMMMMMMLLTLATCQASNTGSLVSTGRIRKRRFIHVPSETKPRHERPAKLPDADALDIDADIFRMLGDANSMSYGMGMMSMDMSMSMGTSFDSFFEVSYLTVNDEIPSSASFQEAATALATVYNGLGSNRTMENVQVVSFVATTSMLRRHLQNTRRRQVRAILQASGRCIGCPRRSRFTTSSNARFGRKLQEVSGGLPTSEELFTAYREFIAQGNVAGFEDVPEFEESLEAIVPTLFPEETAPPTSAVEEESTSTPAFTPAEETQAPTSNPSTPTPTEGPVPNDDAEPPTNSPTTDPFAETAPPSSTFVLAEETSPPTSTFVPAEETTPPTSTSVPAEETAPPSPSLEPIDESPPPPSSTIDAEETPSPTTIPSATSTPTDVPSTINETAPPTSAATIPEETPPPTPEEETPPPTPEETEAISLVEETSPPTPSGTALEEETPPPTIIPSTANEASPLTTSPSATSPPTPSDSVLESRPPVGSIQGDEDSSTRTQPFLPAPPTPPPSISTAQPSSGATTIPPTPMPSLVEVPAAPIGPTQMTEKESFTNDLVL